VPHDIYNSISRLIQYDRNEKEKRGGKERTSILHQSDLRYPYLGNGRNATSYVPGGSVPARG
jgi:hypothetical protein